MFLIPSINAQNGLAVNLTVEGKIANQKYSLLSTARVTQNNNPEVNMPILFDYHFSNNSMWFSMVRSTDSMGYAYSSIRIPDTIKGEELTVKISSDSVFSFLTMQQIVNIPAEFIETTGNQTSSISSETSTSSDAKNNSDQWIDFNDVFVVILFGVILLSLNKFTTYWRNREGFTKISNRSFLYLKFSDLKSKIRNGYDNLRNKQPNDKFEENLITVPGVGDVKPCCYNAARVKDTYCMCGRAIPDTLIKYFD
ncbi:MAG: hypothetical protein HeimC2_42430 [Candidatus Heimdallarchaeota archaeon LC_2]|nr:MAG: hypothetical protein HeimC2_42430 [Candidatus Heimdallarchaeota archaeon LC_2]